MLVLDTNDIARHRMAAAQQNAAAVRDRQLQQDIQSNTISVAPDGERDTANLLAQMGRPLASQEVIRRLKLANPRLIFERSISNPELTGVYIEKWERNAAGGFDKKKVHICGMESGIMPEFSVLHKATKRVADPELFGRTEPTREVKWKEVETFGSETRGWRTVLIRLMRANLIGRLDVEKYFGWLPSQQSEKWYTQTTGA